jgi:hypothetical protein
MNLAQISDDDLDAQAIQSAKNEFSAVNVVLHHIKEVDRRRLFCKYKCQSLSGYVTDRMGYSTDEADRRIGAMKLMREIPEIEAKMKTNALCMTNIIMARSLFRKEKFSREEKLKFLRKIENKSVRETARLIATISPLALRYDKIRPISETVDEYRFTANISLRDKLHKLRGMLGHSHPGIELGDLVEMLADLGLEKWDKGALPPDSRRQDPESKAGQRREVYRRDQVCVNCGSTYCPEVDHRISKALGGEDSLENFRLLCRKCNQRAAIETYGLAKMDPYLNKT